MSKFEVKNQRACHSRKLFFNFRKFKHQENFQFIFIL